jgi:hypothetical protein
MTIRTDLTPGEHILRCELLEATADPGGGHEFRIISVMRYVPLPFFSPRFFPSFQHITPSLPFPFSNFDWVLHGVITKRLKANVIVCKTGSCWGFMAFNGLSILLDIDLDGLGVYNVSQRHFNDHAYIYSTCKSIRHRPLPCISMNMYEGGPSGTFASKKVCAFQPINSDNPSFSLSLSLFPSSPPNPSPLYS